MNILNTRVSTEKYMGFLPINLGSVIFRAWERLDSSPTVAEIAEEYLAGCRTKAKQSTCSTYAAVIQHHILPEFGRIPICRVSAEDINTYLYNKAFSGGDSLSAATVRVIVSVLRAIFQYAEERGLRVAPWKTIRRPTHGSRETRVLTAEEQDRLRDYLCCDIDREKLGVMICLYTGLRIGEICALKWGDVSFERGTLSVRRTVQRIKNLDYCEGCGDSRTKVIFDAPKSQSSSRCIPLPSFLLKMMEPHRCEDDCFLLTGQAESFMEPRVFQNRYRAMMKNAGVDYVNFHALRHTFATNCVNLGFDVKTLSEILGHSNVSVTLNTYVHPSVSVMRSYMELLK